jgi:adenylate cyclase class 2
LSNETEIKLPVPSVAFIADRLEKLGFKVKTPRHFEANLIIDSADSSLRARGELLRVRDAGGHVIITYKGPALTGRHKTREEIEVGADNFDQTLLLFERLGYAPRFRYEKYRTEYQRLGDPGLVTLDETPIGAFIEIEGPPEWIDSTAARLGFDESQYVTASYGRLYLEWCHEQRVQPGHMVF